MIYPAVGCAKKCLSKGVGEYFWFTRLYLYDSCTSVETSRLLLWYGRDFGSNDRQVLLFFFGAVDVIFCMLYSCILIHVALYQNNPNLSKDEDITVNDERWLPSGQSSSG